MKPGTDEKNNFISSMAYIVGQYGKKDSAWVSDEESRDRALGYYRLAKLFYDKSDLDNAKDFFLNSLEIWSLPEDLNYIFKVLGFLIQISHEKQNHLDLENFVKESEELVMKSTSMLKTLTAEHYYNSGMVKTYRGRFLEAIDIFQIAYQKSQQENSPEVLAKSVYALAQAYFKIKEYSKALQYLDNLSEILVALRKKYLCGAMNLLYGNIYSELNEYQKALSYFEKAHSNLNEKTCWNLFGRILISEGIIYKKMGEFNKALFYFDFALSSVNKSVYKRLTGMLKREIEDVNDSNVDLILDRTNRMVYEKNLGPIDFKHRFVLLEILFLLATNAGVYFDKEDLAKSIWKDQYNPLIHDKLIYTSVSRLRKLIEPKNQKRKYIIRGKDGYAFSPKIKVRFHQDTELEKNSSSVLGIELGSPV